METHDYIPENNNNLSEQNDYEKRFHENIRLIYYMMKFYKKPNDFDNDDWFQIGAISLWRSCHTFDPQKNFKFSTWATSCIRNGFLQEYRRRTYNNHKANYNSFSLDVLITNGELNPKLELNGLTEDRKADVEAEIIAKDLLQFIMKKETLEMKTYTILMLKGYQGKEIGEMLGKTQPTSSRKLKKVRKKTLSYYKNIS